MYRFAFPSEMLLVIIVVVVVVVLMMNRDENFLFDFYVFNNRHRHVFYNRNRYVFYDRHLLDHLNLLHDRHVHRDVDLGHVMVMDRVYLVRDVDGHVFAVDNKIFPLKYL